MSKFLGVILVLIGLCFFIPEIFGLLSGIFGLFIGLAAGIFGLFAGLAGGIAGLFIGMLVLVIVAGAPLIFLILIIAGLSKLCAR